MGMRRIGQRTRQGLAGTASVTCLSYCFGDELASRLCNITFPATLPLLCPLVVWMHHARASQTGEVDSFDARKPVALAVGRLDALLTSKAISSAGAD